MEMSSIASRSGAAALAAKKGRYVPPHYLRRVARSIVIRAAVRGRLSWHVVLPMLSKIGGAL